MKVDQLHLVNMAEQVNVQDAKTRLSELLGRVERGEEIIIARSGTPIARLTTIGERPLRHVGFAPDLRLPDSFFFDALPDEEQRLWDGE